MTDTRGPRLDVDRYDNAASQGERLTVNGEPVWDYEFSVWPHEASGSSHATYDRFRGQHRSVESATEQEWAAYRSAMERDGLTIRECERRPAYVPEIVR